VETDPPICVCVETARRRVFVAALDWPGWARSGRDEVAALDAFLAAAARYAPVAAEAGLTFPTADDDVLVEVAERLDGGSGTEFGVPSAIAEADRRAVDAAGAARLAALVEAAWSTFDRVAADAPAELRRGPRGGGRDTAKIVGHVTDADAAYARVIGVRLRPAVPRDRTAVEGMRAAMLDVLRQPSDGSPVAGRHWPHRYAARRIAWHALDHAWEIEDRTESPS
jgi:hypothetical protein